jgi:DNA invertase Pin-like site-specific DNA recombinase
MLVGYARVSTFQQNLNLQTDALKKIGCKKIFSDVKCGADFNRKGLSDALRYMSEGDTLVVWRLDRLGRSLKDLIETVNMIHNKKMFFRSLMESIETNSSTGKLIFHIFCALSEFEKSILRERTMAGLASARARGRLGGRPSVMDTGKLKAAKSLLADGQTSINEISKTLNVSKATLYRHVYKKVA